MSQQLRTDLPAALRAFPGGIRKGPRQPGINISTTNWSAIYSILIPQKGHTAPLSVPYKAWYGEADLKFAELNHGRFDLHLKVERNIAKGVPLLMHESFPGIMFQAGDRVAQHMEGVALVRNHRFRNVYFVRFSPYIDTVELSRITIKLMEFGSLESRNELYKNAHTTIEPVFGRKFGTIVGHVADDDYGQPTAVGAREALGAEEYERNLAMETASHLNGQIVSETQIPERYRMAVGDGFGSATFGPLNTPVSSNDSRASSDGIPTPSTSLQSHGVSERSGTMCVYPTRDINGKHIMAVGPRPPRHANRRTNELYKTELCKNYLEWGHCRYGRTCQFAHGMDELRPVKRHEQWRSKTCTAWLQGGCTYGNRCCYAHEIKGNIEELKNQYIPKLESRKLFKDKSIGVSGQRFNFLGAGRVVEGLNQLSTPRSVSGNFTFANLANVQLHMPKSETFKF